MLFCMLSIQCHMIKDTYMWETKTNLRHNRTEPGKGHGGKKFKGSKKKKSAAFARSPTTFI